MSPLQVAMVLLIVTAFVFIAAIVLSVGKRKALAAGALLVCAVAFGMSLGVTIGARLG